MYTNKPTWTPKKKKEPQNITFLSGQPFLKKFSRWNKNVHKKHTHTHLKIEENKKQKQIALLSSLELPHLFSVAEIYVNYSCRTYYCHWIISAEHIIATE